MNIYSVIHYLTIIFVVITPFVVSNPRYLLIYIILATLIILHWKFNNNQCILTNWEKESHPQEFEEENEEFITGKLAELGMGDIVKFEYFTEALSLFLIVIAALKIYHYIS